MASPNVKRAAVSQQIIRGLKSAKTMSDVALSSMSEIDQYTATLTSNHQPADVRFQGEIIKNNMRQMLRNQEIIMEELRKLEVAIKHDMELGDPDNDIAPLTFNNSRNRSVGSFRRVSTPQSRRERTPKLIRLDR